MDLSRLTRRAKELVDKRGGTQSLKEDAEELRDIARSKSTTSDKAREAFDAIRQPGAPGGPSAGPGAPGERRAAGGGERASGGDQDPVPGPERPSGA